VASWFETHCVFLQRAGRLHLGQNIELDGGSYAALM